MAIIDIVNLFGNYLVRMFELIKLLFSSLLNGIEFYFTMMLNIPFYLLDMFNSLPFFFKMGLSGIFGLLILVVIFKLLAIIFLR